MDCRWSMPKLVFHICHQIFLILAKYLLPAKIKYLWDALHFPQIKPHFHWWILVSLWSVVAYWPLNQTLWRFIDVLPKYCLPLLQRTSAASCHYLGWANWTSCKTHFFSARSKLAVKSGYIKLCTKKPFHIFQHNIALVELGFQLLMRL